MAEEAVFFGRSGAYGLFIAIVYWFVSYELVGSVLLLGFGVATGGLFLVLGRSARKAAAAEGRAEPSGSPDLRPDGPFGDDGGAVPLRSLAPFEMGAGLAITGLGLVFGIWFLLAGLLPLAAGGWDWLASARHEAALVAGASSDPGSPRR